MTHLTTTLLLIFSSFILYGIESYAKLTSTSKPKSSSISNVTSAFQFLLLHTNNIYGRFTEFTNEFDKKEGGFARIAYSLEKARNESIPVVYLDAGGTSSGTTLTSTHGIMIAAEFMNLLKPSAMCLGYSEFDFGMKSLSKFLEKVTFPVVVSNFLFKKEVKLQQRIKRFATIDLQGKKVGIVGYIDSSLKTFYDIRTLEVTDVVAAVENVTLILKVSHHVDVIIAIGHASMEAHENVAKFVKNVDVIVGGFPYTLLWKDPTMDRISEGQYIKRIQQSNGKIVPIVQAYAFTKRLGQLLVSIDNKSGVKHFAKEPIVLNDQVPQDSKVLEHAEKLISNVEKLEANIIGRSKVLLDGKSCGMKECNMGNLMTDSLVVYGAANYQGEGWTDASIAMINSDATRLNIDPSLKNNTVSVGDVLSSIPFHQLLYVIEMRGEDIMAILSSQMNTGTALMTSGLNIVYSVSEPKWYEVESVKLRCMTCKIPSYIRMRNSSLYKVITIQYLIQKGIKTESVIPWPGVSLGKAVIDYFQMKKWVSPEVDERTSIVEKEISPGINIEPNLKLVFLLTTSFYISLYLFL